VCLRGVFTDEIVPVMTFPWVFACAWILGSVASFARATLFKRAREPGGVGSTVLVEGGVVFPPLRFLSMYTFA